MEYAIAIGAILVFAGFIVWRFIKSKSKPKSTGTGGGGKRGGKQFEK
jgi:hypothetical protein